MENTCLASLKHFPVIRENLFLEKINNYSKALKGTNFNID